MPIINNLESVNDKLMYGQFLNRKNKVMSKHSFVTTGSL